MNPSLRIALPALMLVVAAPAAHAQQVSPGADFTPNFFDPENIDFAALSAEMAELKPVIVQCGQDMEELEEDPYVTCMIAIGKYGEYAVATGQLAESAWVMAYSIRFAEYVLGPVAQPTLVSRFARLRVLVALRQLDTVRAEIDEFRAILSAYDMEKTAYGASLDSIEIEFLLAQERLGEARDAFGDLIARILSEDYVFENDADRRATLASAYTRLAETQIKLFETQDADRSIAAAFALETPEWPLIDGFRIVLLSQSALSNQLQQRHREAITIARQAVAISEKRQIKDPAAGTAYLVLATSLLQMGELREAESAARLAVAINQKNGTTNLSAIEAVAILATILNLQGKLDEAIGLLKPALEIWPSIDIRLLYVDALVSAGRVEEAIEMARPVIALEGELTSTQRVQRFQARTTIMRLAIQSGEYDIAKRLYAALETDMDDPLIPGTLKFTAKMTVGLLAMAERDLPRAIELLGEVVANIEQLTARESPLTAWVMNGLATVYGFDGQYERQFQLANAARKIAAARAEANRDFDEEAKREFNSYSPVFSGYVRAAWNMAVRETR